jgi:excisionase family DNA binding protein
MTDEQNGHIELLTVREVAEQLRVDETTIRRWIKAGTLPAVTLPHKGTRNAYRIKQSVLDKLLSGQAVTS